MRRRTFSALAVLAAAGAGFAALVIHARATFPSDRTPEGAYLRIAIAVGQGRPRDVFPYLETRAQHALYTVREYRARACDRVAAAYPEPERSRLLAAWGADARAPDAADVWLRMAGERGWLGRLRRDLSGIRAVEVEGDRASVETARGTRYPFRRRENGIWGLTLFTGDLVADAEKAARDFEIVRRAADDYRRATAAGAPDDRGDAGAAGAEGRP